MNWQEGLLFINTVDVFTEYSAILSEDKASDNSNYAALLKPADMKPYIAVSFREENGEKLPNVLTSRSEARDVTLQFAIIANNANTYMNKYKAFIQFLKSGWLNVDIPELSKTFKMFLVSFTNYDQITPLDDSTDVAARFKVKFREPNPSF